MNSFSMMMLGMLAASSVPDETFPDTPEPDVIPDPEMNPEDPVVSFQEEVEQSLDEIATEVMLDHNINPETGISFELEQEIMRELTRRFKHEQSLKDEAQRKRERRNARNISIALIPNSGLDFVSCEPKPSEHLLCGLEPPV